MPTLPSELRNKLDNVVVEARDVAEAGARAALEALAVHHHELYRHQTPEQRKLRVRLRAHARQLGDSKREKSDDQGTDHQIDHLVHECAYEHWHRMLFSRFLAENSLLIEPSMGVPMSLSEAEELAKEAKVDLWTYASRCAQQMLPQIFRPDDPVLQVGLATEHRVKLERLLAGLAATTFKADDALGWVYQFWQSKKKGQVNDSGEKITGDTLPAVTQLFTEHYMVLFLLHNTIGAWHAGKVLAANPKLAETAASEDALRQAVALKTAGGYSFDYLRFVRGVDGKGGPWRPAAGTFEAWPKTAAQLKTLDPCCGSGHFLVAKFELLVRLRMGEENLSVEDAIDAVLRDNIHGLELDARCTQIAAFNLAMAAWKLAGHRKLPPMHIACTGIAPQATLEQWLKLAEPAIARAPLRDRDPLRLAIRGLHGLFNDAPTLGSLIDPSLTSMVGAAAWEDVEPYLASAIKAEADDEEHERAVAAADIATAATLLAGEYTLVITNVPYLGRGKQDAILQAWAEQHQPDAKADLATMFISRAMDWLSKGGTLSVVGPQNWLFLTTYKHLRARLLKDHAWNSVARLGPGAFETIGGHVVNVALVTLTRGEPTADHAMAGLDASPGKTPAEKAALLRGDGGEAGTGGTASADLRQLPQAGQRKNPDAAIALSLASAATLLEAFADCYQGSGLADITQFRQVFWERPEVSGDWVVHVSSPIAGGHYSGMHYATFWANGAGDMANSRLVTIRGRQAWGRTGVALASFGTLAGGVYLGTLYDNSASTVVPKDASNFAAVWCFCTSPDYKVAVRRINQKFNVTNSTLVKVPFDLAHWQQVAAEKYPDGLPEPESDDPTQWLFHGWPAASENPLQVAVARLAGYRWPAEVESGAAENAFGSAEHSSGSAEHSLRSEEHSLRSNEHSFVTEEHSLRSAEHSLESNEHSSAPEEHSFGAAERSNAAGAGRNGRADDEEPSPQPFHPAISAATGVPGEGVRAMRLSARARELVRRCEELLAYADDDGIICIPSVRGEEPAADRLLTLLSACGIKPDRDLDEWLRNDFFKEHCELFHQRPFIWHIWDGRKRDGFHALVNYHKLADGKKGKKLLESLTYSYLGEWINRQKDGVKRGEDGAEDRLAAAMELQKRLVAILEGEPPFDLFARWKPLSEQPIGWEPDINDGVRINIRPFLASDLPNGRAGAGVLRWKPNIPGKWDKDRGKEPNRKKSDFPWFWAWDQKTANFMGGSEFDGKRWNDCHYKNETKQMARDAAKMEGK
jgi:hypothetical protein